MWQLSHEIVAAVGSSTACLLLVIAGSRVCELHEGLARAVIFGTSVTCITTFVKWGNVSTVELHLVNEVPAHTEMIIIKVNRAS